ncbi:hypothetical protein C8F04DRAFT_1192134 [Mycena alexandri]|uniref:Uncharacterized protein n=1 Tax=Mycena alexandri TaxID=1745969 RepID=A0AAD6WV87_9AGAR|nr:hypothetical protein C8F04DRAFT_1192134 [Mycena alexandri]
MECGKQTSRSLLPLPPYSRLHPAVAGDELNHCLDQLNLEVALDKDMRTRIYEGGGLISGGTAKDSDKALSCIVFEARTQTLSPKTILNPVNSTTSESDPQSNNN